VAALIAAQLSGELAGRQPLAAADLAGPVVAFHFGGQPLRIGGVAGDGGLLVAASGKVGLQPGELPGGGAAVADRLAQDLQTLAAGVLGAQPGQPLARHRRRGADLSGQLGRVKAPATAKLPAQVGVGDPVAHQPRPQLGQGGVAVALGPQHPQQVTCQTRGHADLPGQGGRVDGLAGVDLTLKPGVGDPLPGRPGISRPLQVGLVGGAAGRLQLEGHCRPPPAPARPPARPAAGAARALGGAGGV
jgi:hypothetical protein